MTSLLSIAYLPPVSYVKECISADEICIEQQEHFIKQTYRNRCYIYGPNGKQSLIIPVRHENIFRTPIKDIKISFEERWNAIHWKAITSAYRNSPYFEFYEDDFKKIYEEPGENLFNFNLTLIKLIFELFKIKKQIILTSEYQKESVMMKDLRNAFHPKKNNFVLEEYHQVFKDRHGFINDLSCIDYLFNVGVK